MKRIQAFEFEDLNWFPRWLRDPMTNLILVMHRLLKTHQDLEELVDDVLAKTGRQAVFDFCSGGGGLMPEVMHAVNANRADPIPLQLSDLYPNQRVAAQINENEEPVSYLTEPVDVTSNEHRMTGLRTMICSFHHMPPEQATAILKSASDANEPLLIYEMSDNSIPHAVAWIGFFTTFLTCLFITPFARRLTFRQMLLTYIIPIIPICFAWDGTISNLRTYTTKDLDTLLAPIRRNGYQWEVRTLKRTTKRLAVIGIPTA